MIRTTIAVVALTAVTSLSAAYATPATITAGRGPEQCAVPEVDDACETWVAPFRGGGHAGAGGLVATRPMAASPDGRRVFVVGTGDNIPGAGSDIGALTLAYDSVSGARLWARRHDGPANGSDDRAIGVVADPSGEGVYTLVNSYAERGCGGALLAYDAASGDERWRWQGDCHSSLDVSPDGSTVYLARGHSGRMAVTAIATSGPPGVTRWTATVPAGPDSDGAWAKIVAVAPDGATLYLGGAQYRDNKAIDLTVAAVRTGVTAPARAGEVVWVAHDPVTEAENFYPPSGVVGMAVSPDGSRVFVTGSDNVYPGGATGRTTDGGMLTYAHDAGTGEALWRARHSRPDPADPLEAFYHVGPGNLAVSPDGQRVFVTALASRPLWDGAQRQGPATVAYDAADGRELWAVESSLPGQLPYYLGTYAMQAVSADGATVYATSVVPNPGPSWGTMAYDALTGARRWTARYGIGGSAYPRGIVASPTGGVFVAGTAAPVRNCVSVVVAGACAPTPFPNSYELVTVRYDG